MIRVYKLVDAMSQIEDMAWTFSVAIQYPLNVMANGIGVAIEY
jgi:hypothetical protein